MKTEIHRLSLGMGICNCYLIKEDGIILVDTGMPNQEKKFSKLIMQFFPTRESALIRALCITMVPSSTEAPLATCANGEIITGNVAPNCF